MTLPIVTVEGYRLGVQAWAGQNEPDMNRPFTLGATQGPRPKPHDGFFTSAWDPIRRSSAWLDFMREHGQRTPEGRRVWTLQPDPIATLYVIDSIAHYKALADAFPQRWDQSPKNPSYSPNWNQIASTKPFDGIHVTSGVVQAGRAQSPKEHPQFTGWDVESTLWLIARFTRSGSVGALGPGWELE